MSIYNMIGMKQNRMIILAAHRVHNNIDTNNDGSF